MINYHDWSLSWIDVVDSFAENFHPMPNHCRTVGRLSDKGSMYDFVGEVAGGSVMMA